MSRKRPSPGTLRHMRRQHSLYCRECEERKYGVAGVTWGFTGRDLDRLITIYGPGATLESVMKAECERERKARPKNTDEVADATRQQDGELHGGDGASGEVQDSPDRPSDGSDDQASPELAPGEEGGEATSSDGAPSNLSEAAAGQAGTPEGGRSREAEQAQAEAASDVDRPTDERGEPHPSASQDDSSEGQEGQDAPASHHDGECDTIGDPGSAPGAVGGLDAADEPHNPTVGEASSPDAAAGSGETDPEADDPSSSSGSGSRRPTTMWGGIHADEREARRLTRSPATRQAARAVQRELDRLVQACVSGGREETPRIDPKRLVTHLAARRGGLHRCRREESARPIVLLTCDESGSCSVVATPTLAACLAVARGRDDVMVVEHSNGHPISVHGRAAQVCPPQPDWTTSWWDTVISRCEIAGVISFGDWDAAEVYSQLAALAPFWWLDSYGCAMAPHPYTPSTTGTGEWAAVFRRSWPGKTLPRAYWCGVGSAESAAYALKRCQP